MGSLINYFILLYSRAKREDGTDSADKRAVRKREAAAEVRLRPLHM